VTARSLERPIPGSVPELAPPPPVVVRPLRRDVEREVNYVRSCWSRDAMKDVPARIALTRPADRSRPEPVEPNTWVSAKVARMDPQVYFEAHVRRLVPRLFARSAICLAEPKATPGLVAGWIAFERAYRAIEPGFAVTEADRPCVVHYIYVQRDFRRSGVARALLATLPPGPVTYSHWSPAMEWIAARRGWTFDATRVWD
jgi:GNAT superfamily N-acetyltransferase